MTTGRKRPRLTTLKPRVQVLGSPLQTLKAPTARDRRQRGSSWLKVRERIMARDCGLCRCAMCASIGRVLLAHEVDHVTPLWKGGTDDDDNLAAINADCHREKTRREEEERRALGR